MVEVKQQIIVGFNNYDSNTLIDNCCLVGSIDNVKIGIDAKSVQKISFDLEKQRWLIQDLTCDYYNTNGYGLWRSLSDYKFTNQRYSPKNYELENGDELKLSETIIRISWNIYKKKYYSN